MPKIDVLVDTAWLLDHLRDPNIKIIEISGLFVPFNFHGHIPGSLVLDWRKDLWHPTMREFIGKEDFERLMSLAGISNDTTVVFCSLGKQFITYAFWVFKLYGHKNARILDGGLVKWMHEKLPLQKNLSVLSNSPITEYKVEKLDESIRAFRDYVSASLRKGNVTIIDARSPQEYRGELINAPGLVQEGAYCSGHIPSAINIHFEDNFQSDSTFKSIDDLRRMYQSYGVSPENEVITYCRTGHRGSVTWFVLRHLLKFPKVRLYDGSWTEWGNLVSANIEK